MRLAFHDLATVEVAQPTEGLDRQCRRLFGRFITEGPEGADPDIRIEPLDSAMRRWAAPRGRKNPDPLVVIERDGRPLVVHGYGDRVDVLADPGETIRLWYHPDGRGSQKVIGRLFVYLQLLLRRRGGLLFKGAALAKGGQCVVITGFSGGGKTSLLLEMLASGWDFVSDDTFILAGGRAHLFRPFIVLNQYHFGMLGAAPAGASRPPALRAAGLRRLLRRLAMAGAPRAMEHSEKLQRLCDPRFRVDPCSLHAGCALLDSARPTALWIVRPGEHTAVRAIAPEDALCRVQAIQRLTYDEFERVRAQLAVFAGAWPSPPADELIRANLQGAAAFEVARAPGRGEGQLADLLATGLPGGEPARSGSAPAQAAGTGHSASAGGGAGGGGAP